jgi:ParB-like chromosome segregation protein Spo0J
MSAQNKPEWQNRIVGHGEVNPEELLANPANWRIHPRAQQDAMEGVLDEIGFVQSVLVNQRTGFVLDGHMRVSLALRKDAKSIPVAYVDLTPEEEALVLATLDPIGAMAATDSEQLLALLETVEVKSEDVNRLLSELIPKRSGSDDDAPTAFDDPEKHIDTKYKCPKCAYEWSGSARP